MKYQLILTFILSFFLSLLFVDAADYQIVPVSQVVPLPVNVRKAGGDNYTVEITWDVFETSDDEKGLSLLRCSPTKVVTVRNPLQSPAVGARGITYDIVVHKKGTFVVCTTRYSEFNTYNLGFQA